MEPLPTKKAHGHSRLYPYTFRVFSLSLTPSVVASSSSTQLDNTRGSKRSNPSASVGRKAKRTKTVVHRLQDVNEEDDSGEEIMGDVN
jgi:hypothetical protein